MLSPTQQSLATASQMTKLEGSAVVVSHNGILTMGFHDGHDANHIVQVNSISI